MATYGFDAEKNKIPVMPANDTGWVKATTSDPIIKTNNIYSRLLSGVLYVVGAVAIDTGSTVGELSANLTLAHTNSFNKMGSVEQPIAVRNNGLGTIHETDLGVAELKGNAMKLSFSVQNSQKYIAYINMAIPQ